MSSQRIRSGLWFQIGIETYGNNSVTANVPILFALWHKDLI